MIFKLSYSTLTLLFTIPISLHIIQEKKCITQIVFDHDTMMQCEEEYGHMGTLCLRKLFKKKEIKESYIKCAHNAQAAKLQIIKGRV